MSHSQPRVSVVVPVRNRRALLRGLLDALADQTYGDCEVVIVDDGSSDGSGAEAEKDAQAGRPVRVVRTEGAGAVAARRAGVSAARGDIIAFTDSDCVPEPDWLKVGVITLEGGADVVQGRTTPLQAVGCLERSINIGREDGLFATCNVFYRRAAYDAAGGFDPDVARRFGFRVGSRAKGLGFGEDSLLGWRVRREGHAVFAPDAVVGHHVFEPHPVDVLSRAWMAGAFPALVREVPELRRVLLRRRLFLGHPTRTPLYAAALAISRPKLAGALLAWWVALVGRRVIRAEPSWRRRLSRVPLALAVEAVTAGALLLGSARARRLVL